MSEPQTLPQYFLKRAQQCGDKKVALRQKEFGVWKEFTWQESYEQVKQFCLGMIALGLRRGDHVVSVGDNDRQYLWAFLGIHAAGAVNVGLYTDSTAQEMAYVASHSDAVFALAKDQEQCDKFLEIRDKLPNIQKVIYWEDKGLWSYDDPWLMPFAAVQALGRELTTQEPKRFEQEIALGKGADLAMLCYTSGTTGLPKAVMLSHTSIMHSGQAYMDIDPRFDTDNHLSFMPMGWIAEPIFGFVPHALTGMVMNFPEEPETVRENIREIAPENLFYNSRLWDNLVATVQVRMNDATWINRKLYETFLPIGYRYADKKLANESIPLGLKLAYGVGNVVVFGPLRDQLGLARLRSAYTAGSSLSPDAMRFFHAMGINLKQIYGSTEVAGGATLHREGDIKFASVGKAAPGVELRISEEGEIQISGPTVMTGYYKNPEATAKDITVDERGRRWFKTGDAGYIDPDGHLIYLDRVKDMIKLANGESFSPQFIEGRLKFNPYIRDVMAIGGETRDFVTAMVIIEFGNVGNWAEKNRIGYTTFVDLSQKPEVYELIRKAVQEVNESLPPAGRVKRFVLMHKEFDADEAEMTRTRKLRRGFLAERYGEIIEAMYNGAEFIQVRAPVKYQDGTEGFVETALRIATP